MDNFNQQLEERRLQLNKTPEDFSANYGIGNLYYEEGDELLNKSENTNSESEQQKLEQDGKNMLQESIHYFEKANVIDPENKEVVRKLKSVYSQFSMNEKIKGINERIKE